MNFLIPKLSLKLYENIECIPGGDGEPILSNSLNFFLNDVKKKISLYENEWNIYKKYTNPYEFIHTTIPQVHNHILPKVKCIAKHHPLSRSYFKMIEIIKFFEIDKCYDSSINCFHLAEGPGGFIEALVSIRENKDDVYTGMTLLDENKTLNIPAWKKSSSFLKNNSNVFIENGKDGTGNIISIENLDFVENKYANSMNIITADGGFDFSTDFDNQELNMTRLLYAQIVYAIAMQNNSGCFILKVFDIFMSQTVDMIAILSSLYEKVFITKPHTSRYANSEKYIICIGFIAKDRHLFYPIIRRSFEEMLLFDEHKHISRFLNISIPCYFMNRLDESNAIFGQRQLEYIHSTITLIEDNHRDFKIVNIRKANLYKCIRWCSHHNVPHHLINTPTLLNLNVPSRNCFIQKPPNLALSSHSNT